MKRRIINKITATALSVVTLLSAVPVYADTTGTQETAEAGSKDATVLYDMSADYTITIPKTIKLDSTKETDYSVKVEGDIPSDEKVHVAPVDAIEDTEGVNFYMKDQSTVLPKSDVTATVTQDKTEWSFKEVANGTETTDNKVSATDLTSGTWKGNFAFEINMMSLLSISVNATDSNGDNLNASATAIVGEEKENLLNELESSGLVSSADDVDALIDVDSDEFDDLANATFDVSDIANTGDKVVILHYDETKGEWEYIGTDTVDENGNITGDFTSFSPIAFVKVTDDGTYEHVHVYNDLLCNCGETAAAGLYDENNIMLMSWNELVEADVITVTDGVATSNGSSDALDGKLVIQDGITLGVNGFSNCDKLTEVVLPKSVTSLPNYVFSDCDSLTKINLDNITHLYSGAFSGGAWKHITIPNVTFLSAYLLDRCKSLESVVIPRTVTSIEMCAFNNCTSLKTIYFEGTYEEWEAIGKGRNWNKGCPEDMEIIYNWTGHYHEYGDDYTCTICGLEAKPFTLTRDNYTQTGMTTYYSEEVTIPETFTYQGVDYVVTEIGEDMFDHCGSIKKITMPDSITALGAGAIGQCFNLNEINLSSNLRSIGSGAFTYSGMSNDSGVLMDTLVLPDGIEVIGDKAFGNSCFNTIVIPDSVTEIGNSAFAQSTVRNVNIPESVTKIGNKAFEECRNLGDIVVPESVTEFGTDMFLGATINSVKLPSNMKEIPTGTFGNCKTSEVIIPDGVEVVSGFSYATIEKVVMPTSVMEISDYAFMQVQIGKICYKGTEEQWNAITKTEGEWNYLSSSLVVEYNYTGE